MPQSENFIACIDNGGRRRYNRRSERIICLYYTKERGDFCENSPYKAGAYGSDAGQVLAGDPAVFLPPGAGESVPAVLCPGGHHHRGAVRGRGSAGSGRQRGRPELSGAGLCQRHCLRLFYPHLMDLRCPRPPRDAPLHRQYRVAVHRLCHGAHHRYGGYDPAGAGVDEHPG